MSNEVWKKIKGFERYEVSNLGRVRSRTKGKPLVMKQLTHYKGYKYIYIWNHKKCKFFVHRLVAITFIINPDNKPIVNHIDENKANNHILNLEWMTDGENTRYYWAKRGVEINPSNLEF